MKIYRVDVRQWRDALTDAVELDLACRGMLFILTRWMDANGGSCYPGRARIAGHCGVSESAVARHLATAVAAGYLCRDGGGRRGQNANYVATVRADRLDDHGRITPRKVELACHPRHPNDEDSVSDSRRKGVTRDTPNTYVRTTSKNTPSFSSPSSADADGDRDDDHDDGSKIKNGHEGGAGDPADLVAVLGELTTAEQNLADGMIGNGAHPRAVLSKIKADRRAGAQLDVLRAILENENSDHAQAYRDAKYAVALHKPLGAAITVRQFGPERVGQVADESLMRAIESTCDGFVAWHDAVMKARSGFRVVQGGRQ